METQAKASLLTVKEGLGYFFFGLLFLIVKTTIWMRIDPEYFGPDLLLILITYLGLSSPPLMGSILVLGLGFISDTLSGGPLGLFTAIYLIIFWIVIMIRQDLDPAAPFYQILVTLLLAALSASMVWGFLSLYDRGFEPSVMVRRPLFLVTQGISVLVTGFISPVFFWFFERLRLPEIRRKEQET
ncbi:MAG: rod shape-determining protein MreD [Deltaproteobacteria bacterium]|nr:rod shape-determining protein MreD [Deltaproteobacteria bacterium]